MQNYECGKIKFKLAQILKDRNLSKNKLSITSGVRSDTILRLCKGNLTRLDLDIVCRLCKTLDCSIEDLIEYEK